MYCCGVSAKMALFHHTYAIISYILHGNLVKNPGAGHLSSILSCIATETVNTGDEAAAVSM